MDLFITLPIQPESFVASLTESALKSAIPHQSSNWAIRRGTQSSKAFPALLESGSGCRAKPFVFLNHPDPVPAALKLLLI
jgi:hypothetical protein